MPVTFDDRVLGAIADIVAADALLERKAAARELISILAPRRTIDVETASAARAAAALMRSVKHGQASLHDPEVREALGASAARLTALSDLLQ